MKKSFLFFIVFLMFIFVTQSTVLAEKVTVPLSKPNAPCTLNAKLHTGGITVTGYNGKDVIVTAEVRTIKIDKNDRKESKGLKRIPNASMDLSIEEDDNEITIRSSSLYQKIDLNIQVPYRTSLNLRSHHNGNIVVDNVTGDIEADNHHGSIKIDDISGTVVADTHHGYIHVTFNKVTAGKPMSFSTYHGNIEVTFPASIKANLKIKSDRGDIYTDFNMKTLVKPQKTIKKRNGGKYVVKIEKGVFGAINGGGPEMFFKTYHGNIYIKKGK